MRVWRRRFVCMRSPIVNRGLSGSEHLSPTFMILMMTRHRGTQTQSPFFSLETHSADSVFHHLSVEIQDQADTQSCDAQVREHLCDEHRIEALDALYLHDHLVADDQIWPVFRYEFAFVKQRYSKLACVCQTRRFELDADCRFVHRLQKPRSQIAMHINGATNDLVRSVNGEAVVRVHLCVSVSLWHVITRVMKVMRVSEDC